MASSNRHWPSFFKSKPTYNSPHQDHHCHSHRSSSPYTSGCDERTPEPKPRWNPKPEQIRILESIFNSGLVNPPRDEIRRIRARLQEYGQVGDANVFYWFQNRKSRSKHKNRHLQKSQNNQNQPIVASATKAATTSSSSSDKSSSKSIDFLLNSPTTSVNQQREFFPEPYFFPPASTTISFTQRFCFPEFGTMINQENHHGNDDQMIVGGSGMLLTDLMMNHQYGIPTKNSKSSDLEEDQNMMKILTRSTTPPPPPPLATPTPIVPPAPTTNIVQPTMNDHIQGVEEGGTGKTIVFINDVPFEVAVGPFNVKEAFGGDAVLMDSTGQTVMTNELGVTLQSLQHGGIYYMVRSFTYDHPGTIDLI